MDFDLPDENDPRRDEIRAWLAEHPNPDRATLAAGGFVAPHWPAPWGRGADPELQIIIEQEFERAGVKPAGVSIAVGWAGPTILAGGTPEQQKRWLPSILDGSETFCQLFSEPDAGSDLASLRTTAIRDGDHYVVNGQKIWSTWANHSDWGILIARTNPDAPAETGKKQAGISYFVLDMKTPGITVRPIFEMTGGNHFNETFFDDVIIPADCLIGEEGNGWRLAKVTLGNERLSLSEGGVIWGMGPSSAACFDEIRRLGGIIDPVLRQEGARVYTESKILQLLGYRMMTMALGGKDPGPFASIRKTLADVHGQNITSLVKAVQGTDALCGLMTEHGEEDDIWTWSYLFARALTIGGGTSEVQRNIIGEALLGLPKEPK